MNYYREQLYDMEEYKVAIENISDGRPAHSCCRCNNEIVSGEYLFHKINSKENKGKYFCRKCFEGTLKQVGECEFCHKPIYNQEIYYRTCDDEEQLGFDQSILGCKFCVEEQIGKYWEYTEEDLERRIHMPYWAMIRI